MRRFSCSLAAGDYTHYVFGVSPVTSHPGRIGQGAIGRKWTAIFREMVLQVRQRACARWQRQDCTVTVVQQVMVLRMRAPILPHHQYHSITTTTTTTTSALSLFPRRPTRASPRTIPPKHTISQNPLPSMTRVWEKKSPFPGPSASSPPQYRYHRVALFPPPTCPPSPRTPSFYKQPSVTSSAALLPARGGWLVHLRPSAVLPSLLHRCSRAVVAPTTRPAMGQRPATRDRKSSNSNRRRGGRKGIAG